LHGTHPHGRCPDAARDCQRSQEAYQQVKIDGNKKVFLLQ
jgi:hypothetical protein